MILLFLACRVPCALEVTGPCEATWTDCADDVGYREVRLACTPDEVDPGTVRCSCERDGETRSVWPEDTVFCDAVDAGRRRVLDAVAEEECALD